jgi:DNA-binding NarL/FixJ family response regulator
MPGEIAIAQIGIFLIADNRLLREALSRILNKKSDLRVLEAACFSEEIVRNILNINPDVLLLESCGSEADDCKVVTSVHKQNPGLKIVILGMEADPDRFLRYVHLGIKAFLLKDASASDIAAAVRAVMNGEAICSPKLCLALFDEIARQEAPLYSLTVNGRFRLTRREQQLLQMVSCGLSNKEIASDLNLSDQTVKNHIHHILHKLRATDRMSAVEVCRNPMAAAS